METETIKQLAADILRSRHPGTNAQYRHTGGGVYCIFFDLPGDEVGLCGDADVVWGCEIDDTNAEYVRDISPGLPVDGTTAEQLASAIASKFNLYGSKPNSLQDNSKSA